VAASHEPDRHQRDGKGSGGMSADDIPDNLSKLALDPKAPYVPERIRKRREQFILMPMRWKEALGAKPRARGTACDVALHLLHAHWKSHGKPFKLPNGLLRYDGISRHAKWRALTDLEHRGLIRIARRPRCTPIIQVLQAERTTGSHPGQVPELGPQRPDLGITAFNNSEHVVGPQR
jgi:hypothetical protein